MKVAVCWKWAPQGVAVDPLTAAITPDPHSYGPSAADQAALELALLLADGGAVSVICAGPPAADAMLRDALATGAGQAVRCDGRGDESSHAVGAALAAAVGAEAADLVLCGDYSADRGSGSVPAFLAAELGFAQALGAVRVEVLADASLGVERRLDQGRRERLRMSLPAVVSVEGSVARLRRASLAAVLATREATITPGPSVSAEGMMAVGMERPYRPRPLPRPAPTGDPLARIYELTAATSDRDPPRVLVLDPPAAADAIVAQLHSWGYLD